jgi:hypothetical protein
VGGVLSRQIVVMGSGSFARSVCYGLATELRTPADVLVLARDPAKAAEVALVAAARAGVSSVPATFRSAAVVLDRLDELALDYLDELLGSAEPEVLIHCVSHHSPWGAPSPWTSLVAAAGFGVTLPLQAAMVLDVAESLRRVAPDCLLINACFPDAVNAVLREWELPVFCGAGNIATIAAAMHAALPGKDLRLLAHHAHLHEPADPADEARLWCDGVERDDVRELLAPLRSAARSELNQVGGHAAARLVADLFAGAGVVTHVPGPGGLPGGYPVAITGSAIEPRLPDGLDVDAAVAWNQRMAVHDGVQVIGSWVRFPPRTAAALRAHLPELAGGYPVRDIRAACTEMLELRDRLI